ncbi:hypothetical protein GRJ2_000688300 [Grus japonensis]|uniref:Uncharacterized protein n=1 Tax=Grus japonensis TaxID=30415 RepID=A0ABC9W9K0_GRUJA
MPAGSKMNLPLAKAEPISNGGKHSAITFKKEKKTPPSGSFFSQREESEDVRNSADTKVSEEEEAGGAPGARAEILLQPVEKTMVRQAVPLQPVEDDGGAEIPPAARGGPHAGAGGGT